MAPYEALYGRPYRTPLCWTEVWERRHLDPAIVQETVEQVEMLKIGLRKPMTVRRVIQIRTKRIWSFRYET